MNPRKLLVAALSWVVLACLSLPCLATEKVRQAQDLLQAANAAYADRDYDLFVRQLEGALALNPESLATRYNLACGYALTGRNQSALELLGQLVDMRTDYGMADDPDLASLRAEPAFGELRSRLARNLEPVLASRALFTVDQRGLIPEGIARDPATGRLFFGSMRNGEIYVIDDAGWSRFAAIDSPPGFSVIGLTVDPARNMLWSIGTSTELAAGFDEEAASKTGLFGFDLRTGESRARFLAEPSVAGFNDVAVAPNGDIYLSGTALGVVAADDDRIRMLSTDPALFGTNGITVTPDGGTLFTSVYPAGIVAVELSSGRARTLRLPDKQSLYGVDGLYWHEDGLVAIQNGAKPWRLVRIKLDERQTAVTGIRLIEFANPTLTATTGVIAGDEIIYIGQGLVPDPAPGHVPGGLLPFFGKTIIMAAPLD